MRHLFNKSLGFSLVQVLVAAGLVGGLALVVMQTLDIQISGSKGVAQDQVIANVIDEAKIYLTNREACENSLKVASFMDEDDVSIKTKENLVRFETGQDLGSGVTISRIFLSPGKAGTSPGQRGPIDVKFIFEKQFGRKTKQAARTLRVLAKSNADGVVSSCSSFETEAIENARQLACADLGGEYDRENESCELVEGKAVQESICHLLGSEFNRELGTCSVGFFENIRKSCDAGKVLVGINGDGSLKCLLPEDVLNGAGTGCPNSILDPQAGEILVPNEGQLLVKECENGFSGRKTFQCSGGSISVVTNECKANCASINIRERFKVASRSHILPESTHGTSINLFCDTDHEGSGTAICENGTYVFAVNCKRVF